MKIVVVGGVAAGASVAARARRLDEFAEIVVFERSNHVSFANCGLPYHIGEVITDRDRLLLQTPESLRESLDLDVRIGTEILAIDRGAKSVRARNLATGEEYDEGYDYLALCPGSAPFRPDLPGIDHAGIFVLRNIEDMDAIKAQVDTEVKHAVVIGAGYIGLEMAENLHHRGVTVEIVEMSDQIMPPMDRELTTAMENYLRAHGITLHLGTVAAAFSDSSEHKVTVELKNNTFIDTDLVILAAGVRPSSELAAEAGLELGPNGGIKVDEHMRTSDPDIWAAGDAVEVPHTVLPGSWLIPMAGPANRQGRVAAENMCGRDTTYESTQGTAIVKLFDMVAGGTGATEKQLRALDIPFSKVSIHPSGHAGYYPGTAEMTVKVVFAPDTGRILGAQVAGFDGVDKRLDVLATALRAGLTVYDLEKLELAYAPPFGSAKDPVNMIGFLASNTLQEDLELWYAFDYPEAVDGAQIIDVRRPEEYAIWHIPGAVNVPLQELRASYEDWDRAGTYRLYCASGFRSYLAYRILVQRGFTDVKSLSGGVKTFRTWLELDEPQVEPPPPMVSYAETASLPAPLPPAEAAPTGVSVDLDCTGLACPGPIMKLQQRIEELEPGDEVLAHVSDPGFRLDAPAWADKNGHLLISIVPEGPGYAARFRKGGQQAAGGVAARMKDKKSFVVFSGEFDKQLAAFIIANGALAMGDEVSMFFTFWGLNALRRDKPPAREKSAMERMFETMMPSGPERMPLSQMNMLGGGPALIKRIMKDNNVPSLTELIADAREGGARLVACTMTMELLGMAEEDLLPGIEFGGVATFLGEANESNQALFI